MRVVLCQTKNGLPAALALSMQSLDALTSTSSKVVISYFALRNGRSCMFGTFDMSGNGGNGPSSSTRWGKVGRIVLVGRVAVDQAPWAVGVVVFLVDGERIPVRIRHRVEVVQIPVELVEAVHTGQELVQVAQVVLAE